MVAGALVLVGAPSVRAAATRDQARPDTDLAATAPVHQVSDRDIKDAIEQQFLMDDTVPFHSTDVTVSSGIVTLGGTADTLLAQQRAVQLARAIKGVRAVVNEITVRPVSRPDADLRLDVERALLSDPAASAYGIRVSIKNGVATLDGKVDSWQEKQLAQRVVEGVRGIRGVESRLTIEMSSVRPDQEMAAEIRERLRWDARVDDGLITTKVEGGKAILSGAVGSALERAYAIGDAWVAGIHKVDGSGLDVEWWARDRMRRAKYVIKTDGQVRQAVADALLYDPRVLSFNPQVTVENGIVTLSGVVDNLEARRAAAIDARNTVGALSVHNHLRVRPASALTDSEITQKVEQALRRDPIVDHLGIGVTTYDGEVTLMGDVSSWLESRRAEGIASRTPGVIEVENRLDVTNPVSLLSDREIQSDIEDELLWSPFVDSNEVHVAVNGGVATLTGTVDTWAEYGWASQGAREGGAVRVRNELKVRDVRGALASPHSKR